MAQFNRVVVIGVSAGGLQAIKKLLSLLPKDFKTPVLINQHLPQDRESTLPQILQSFTHMTVKEGEDKEELLNGRIYVAPPAYHMLVEPNYTLSLSADDPENHARPSADVLFESAADVFTDKLIGIVLTGASEDGAKGLLTIQRKGGTIFVQSPTEAEFPIMPLAAIRVTGTKNILTLPEIVAEMLKQGC